MERSLSSVWRSFMHGVATAPVFAAMIAAQPAIAADHDLGARTVLALNKKINDRWRVGLNFQGRFRDNISELSQIYLRPSVEYRYSKKITFGSGVVFLTTRRPGGDGQEYRPWQQVTWKVGKAVGADISVRSRLEQRIFETGDDIGLRFRQQVKLTWRLDDQGRWRLIGSAEPFFNLNDTDSGARSGFNQLRSFVGGDYRVSSRLRVNAGYLNQFSNRATRDRFDHILVAGLALDL